MRLIKSFIIYFYYYIAKSTREFSNYYKNVFITLKW